MNKVKRALISVYDKTGVVSLARSLHAMKVQIISTGGTAELLKKEGIPVQEVASVTQFPEMLDGRVKTLHPRLHAGLLAIRDNPQHVKTLKAHAIDTIDLLVVNLYPFWDAVKNTAREEEVIEMIDIGGPSMLRGAAKNFRFVAAVSDPGDYDGIIRELRGSGGVLSDKTRRTLAGKVFKLTAYYDGLIRDYFSKGEPSDAFGSQLILGFEKKQTLRYGENPHQKAALYVSAAGSGVVRAKQLHGKELSFNNLLDLDAALDMVSAFSQPACAVVKHTSACGLAVGPDAKSAFKRAHGCDPLSAFGGIVGLNRTVDGALAKQIIASGFLECILAPGYSAQALSVLKAKKNLRLLQLPEKEAVPDRQDFKRVSGGLLLQERDGREVLAPELKTVTKKKPTAQQVKDLLFAFKVCHYVKSNAIVIAKAGATLGLGMGLPSRVDACYVAFRKAGVRAQGAVLASDGFFPKPDSIQLAKKHGIKAIIQPGGSIQDPEVIAACDKAAIAMVFTGIRHFRH